MVTFTNSKRTWTGCGVNLWASEPADKTDAQLAGLSLAWARVWIAGNDPGKAGVFLDDAGMDAVWTNSVQIAQDMIVLDDQNPHRRPLSRHPTPPG